MAARIAVNRTVAGLHYPCDSAAGAVLGIAVARWVLARAGAASGAGQVSLDAEGWVGDAPDATRDFHLPALLKVWDAKHHLKQGKTLQVGKAPMLASLWTEVTREWGKDGADILQGDRNRIPGFDDEAWPLLHELIPDGPTIMGKTGQKEIEDALEALNKAAFGP
ncbi:hypothetical protein ACFSYD_17800 [Paracoccus aerius]